MSEKITLKGGTTRSEKAPAFHLMPKAGAARIARRFELGAEVHGPGNWMKSIHESEMAAHTFCQEAYNHMLSHAMNLPTYSPESDDDLGAIGWAVYVLAYAEDYWRKPWTELGR